MRIWLFLLFLTLGSAHAQTATPVDDIEQFLADRGVLQKVDEWRTQISQNTSDLVSHAMGLADAPQGGVATHALGQFAQGAGLV